MLQRLVRQHKILTKAFLFALLLSFLTNVLVPTSFADFPPPASTTSTSSTTEQPTATATSSTTTSSTNTTASATSTTNRSTNTAAASSTTDTTSFQAYADLDTPLSEPDIDAPLDSGQNGSNPPTQDPIIIDAQQQAAIMLAELEAEDAAKRAEQEAKNAKLAADTAKEDLRFAREAAIRALIAFQSVDSLTNSIRNDLSDMNTYFFNADKIYQGVDQGADAFRAVINLETIYRDALKLWESIKASLSYAQNSTADAKAQAGSAKDYTKRVEASADNVDSAKRLADAAYGDCVAADKRAQTQQTADALQKARMAAIAAVRSLVLANSYKTGATQSRDNAEQDASNAEVELDRANRFANDAATFLKSIEHLRTSVENFLWKDKTAEELAALAESYQKSASENEAKASQEANLAALDESIASRLAANIQQRVALARTEFQNIQTEVDLYKQDIAAGNNAAAQQRAVNVRTRFDALDSINSAAFNESGIAEKAVESVERRADSAKLYAANAAADVIFAQAAFNQVRQLNQSTQNPHYQKAQAAVARAQSSANNASISKTSARSAAERTKLVAAQAVDYWIQIFRSFLQPAIKYIQDNIPTLNVV